MIAADPTPKVTDGSIKLLRPSNPPEGNNPNLTEKVSISISPNQNTGIETPSNANIILKLSKNEYCLVAEIIPTGIPIQTEIIIPITANISVFGNLENISPKTSLPVV